MPGSSADSSAIVESLAGAGLLTSAGIADVRSPLVLVVLGRDPGPESDPILEGLVTGLTGTATGVVVAGEAEAEPGALARLREHVRRSRASPPWTGPTARPVRPPRCWP